MSLLCVSLALVIGPAAALAQSGSAGGSIGNDEKSLSGSRSEPSSDREAPRPHSRKAEEPRGSADPVQDDSSEAPGAAEVVMSRPPAEVVHLDRFRKK